MSAGIPKAVAESVILAPYNDTDATVALIEKNAGDLAAVIVEPCQRGVAPKDGFLESIAHSCRRNGVLLMFDEILTGFWLSYGGGQVRYGVTPDIATFGKVIGGGHPLSAICGRADILHFCDPAIRGTGQYVYEGGTHCLNPVAAAAGLATLKVLRRPGSYELMESRRKMLCSGLREVAAKFGIELDADGTGGIFRLSLAEKDALSRASHAFIANLAEQGIHILPSLRGFVSLAHTEREIDFTVKAFHAALSRAF
jgi:glutamate-1-semialdehyde 2,1-aminomutase